MSLEHAGDSREDRDELTKQALAEIMRTSIIGRTFRQTTIARKSGVSRGYLRTLLRAEKQMSLFILLKLSEALSFEDPCQLLRRVLNRRGELLTERARQHLR
jgi:transcriptional regulator with XRE-family HTH domain